MLRWLYIQLIWLHPAPFRWRFGDDMLDDFDRAPLRDKPRYFADAVVSLGRQWVLRPEFRRPEAPAVTAEAPSVPLFQSIETYKPCTAALVHGGLLGMLWILVPVVLIATGGSVVRPFLIGVHSSRPGVLPFDRKSVAASELNTTVSVKPDGFERWLKLARPYFGSMLVLRALDTDRDLALSPREIENAPAALRTLDSNHDGMVTAEECGLRLDPSVAATTAHVHRQFMSYHPVLAALDTDHDGEISAAEIDHAAAALKTLDSNRDGYVTADELIPSAMASRAGLR